MASYRKKLSAAKSIVSCFRILFRRIGQNPKSPAVIDTAGDSGAVDETINQDTEPPPLPDDVLQARPPSPHECPGLNSEGMEIHGYLRAGIFMGIWDGSPESAPLVFESYLLNSTADPTYPRAVRSYRHSKRIWFADLSSAADGLQGNHIPPAFSSQHRPVSRSIHHPGDGRPTNR